MATIALNYYCDLNQAVKVQYIDGNVFSGDNAGNTISVFVMDGDQPATIGGSVSADVIRADGSTVAVSGALDGNRAYVILPQACYAVPGSISIVIKNTQNTTITTIAALVGNVYRSSTDEIVDPGTIIPSISSLIAAIDAAIGSIPADYSALLASIAADYSSSKTYPVGAYCWEAGVLKRCIVPITSAETYTAAHWTNAVIGDDLSALKSATNEKVDTRATPYGYNKFMNDSSIWEFGGIDTSTGANTSSSSTSGRQRIRTKGYITGVDFIKWLPTSGWTNKINVYSYNSSDVFVEAVAYQATQFGDFDYTQYQYRVTLARNTDESIDVALSRAVFLADKSSFATEAEIEEINTRFLTKTIEVKFEKGRFSATGDDRYYNSLSETKAYMINAYPIIVDGATSVVFPAITLTDSDKYNIYWRDSTGEAVSSNILTCAVDNNTVNVPSGAYYLDIMICYSGLYDFPIKIVGGNIKTGKQQKRIYTKDNGEQVCYFEVNRTKDVYSACCFMLPPNYNATGAKVPLVLWFDGNMNYRTLGSTFKSGKLPGLEYIRDEGYAVLQIYSWGSYFATKYAQCGDDQPYPSPTCLKVLETGLKWFCDRYNIDSENIHIVSKSMGGLISLFFVSHPIAPFRSVSMFSPIIDMFGLRGRYSDARKAIFEDNALQGDVDDFSDINTDGSTSTGVENYYFSDRCLPIWEANKGATARLNSAYAELVGATFAENLVKSIEDSRAWYANHEAANIYNHPEYKKISAIPVKIWGATHDPDVQYQAMVQVVEQLRNSGCDAEIKSVNSYDHSRFDVNTTDAQTITTELGILHEDVPIGWVESIQWIRAHSVKYTVGS